MRGPALAALLLVAMDYALALSFLPKHTFWTPDTGAKYIQMQSIRWDRGLVYDVVYPGAATDPELRIHPATCRFNDFYPFRTSDGTVHYHWPIWFPLAAKPLVSLFGLTGLYILPLLGGCAIAFLSGRLAALHDRRLEPAAILVVGLATPVFFYSLCFWEHTLAAAAAMGAILLAARIPEPRLPAVVLTAALLLIALVLRLETVALVAALPLSWWVAARLSPRRTLLDSPGSARWWRRRWIALGVSAAALLFLLLAGAPARQLGRLHRFFEFFSWQKLRALDDSLIWFLVNHPGANGPVAPRWLEVTALAAYVAALVAPFVRRRTEASLLIAALLATLAFSLSLLLSGQAYVSLHGLFPIAPLLVAAAYGAAEAFRRRSYSLLLTAAAAISFAVLSLTQMFVFLVHASGDLDAGLEWGPRYLLVLYPLGCILALGGLQAFRTSDRPLWLRRGFTILAAVLIACGLGFQIRGIQMLGESRARVARWQAAMMTEPRIVSAEWWIPAAVATLFVEHEMHCARTPEAIIAWLSAPAAREVDTFTVAGTLYLPSLPLEAKGIRLLPGKQRTVSGLHLQRFRVMREPAPRVGG